MIIGQGVTDRAMPEPEARALLAEALDAQPLDGRRVLVIIPDGTRSGPIDLFFRLFHELLSPRVAALDYLLALATRYAGVRIFNHHWERKMLYRLKAGER